MLLCFLCVSTYLFLLLVSLVSISIEEFLSLCSLSLSCLIPVYLGLSLFPSLCACACLSLLCSCPLFLSSAFLPHR
eukprot:m.283946 g.283946  ORF g.283946 m.283946 type:complete len:76 (-) comp133119_c0_seq1:19-246(-)